MNRKTIFLSTVVLALLLSMTLLQQALAEVRLADDKIILNGTIKQTMYYRTQMNSAEYKTYHKTRLDYNRFSALLKAQFKIKDCYEESINFITALKYWYELAPVYDPKMRKGFSPAVPEIDRNWYSRTQDRDYVSEAYIDYIRGPWNIRFGQQIVVWGETDIKRTVDIINPIDVRLGSPGVDAWEEIKLGLFMLRGTYQSQLPGNLLFEALYIPGDFRPARLPVEGTHYGPNPVDGKNGFYPYVPYGVTTWLFDQARKDAPGWELKNYEYGLRVRGFSFNIDWTLLYYNGLYDAPIALADPLNDEFFSNYISKGIIGSITKKPQKIKFSDKKCYKYPRYSMIGGTAQTVIPALHDSVWRLEWFYNHNEPYNRGTNADSSALYDDVKRDGFGMGLNYGDKFKMPWTHRFAQDKMMDVSLTFFYERVFNWDDDIIIAESGRGHRRGAAHSSEIAWNVQQFLFNQQFMIMFTGSYNPIGKYFLCPIFSYVPGNHWRWELGFPTYGSRTPSNKGLHDKDSVLFRMRYEF
jgi:hypothetical protein